MCFPLVRKCVTRSYNNWIEPSLIEKKKTLDKLFLSAKQSNQNKSWNEYRIFKKQYDTDIRETKKNYYTEKILNSQNIAKTS